MGTYNVSMWLTCASSNSDVLTSFNSLWTAAASDKWRLLKYEDLSAPESSTVASALANRLDDEITAEFGASIVTDAGIVPPDVDDHVVAFANTPWSPPISNSPHEGMDNSASVAKKSPGGGVSPGGTWIVKGVANPANTGEVRLNAKWSYVP